MSLFPSIPEIVPEGVSGEVRVEHFEVSRDASALSGFRRGEFVAPGKYARLFVGRTMMMSDTQMERSTNGGVVRHANGHVLIAGLGLGLILHPIAAKPQVRSVLVVEKFADVIALVAPTLPKKCTVVQADIFDWKPERGTKFDTIYFDIWPNITTDNLPQIAKLHQRFKGSLNRSNDAAWMDSWQADRLRSNRRAEKRDEWRWR